MARVATLVAASTVALFALAVAASAGACENRHKFCSDWAERGECKINPGYMLVMCPKACGQCSPTPEPTAEPTAKPPTAGACNSFEGLLENTDLAGDQLAKVKGKSTASCCGACTAMDGCEGFAFLPPHCYLKQNVTGTYPHKGCSTSLKATATDCSSFDETVEGVDLAGELVGTHFASSADHCCSGCKALTGCQGFSFFEQVCYYKATIEGTFPKKGCSVRVLAGLAPAAAPPNAAAVAASAAAAPSPATVASATAPAVALPAPAVLNATAGARNRTRRLGAIGSSAGARTEAQWV